MTKDGAVGCRDSSVCAAAATCSQFALPHMRDEPFKALAPASWLADAKEVASRSQLPHW